MKGIKNYGLEFQNVYVHSGDGMGLFDDLRRRAEGIKDEAMHATGLDTPEAQENLSKLKASAADVGKQLKATGKVVAGKAQAVATSMQEEKEASDKEKDTKSRSSEDVQEAVQPVSPAASNRSSSSSGKGQREKEPTKKKPAEKSNMLIAALAVLVIIVLIVGVGIGSCSSQPAPSSTPESEKVAPMRSVSIGVECEANALFSTYDITVYVDDSLRGTVGHGESKTFDMTLAEGGHNLRMTSVDDSDVDGSIVFTVSGDMTLKYKAKCTSGGVEIEEAERLNPPDSASAFGGIPQEDVKAIFEGAGFTNVSVEGMKDLASDERDDDQKTASVEIDGVKGFLASDEFYESAEVVIFYHSLADLAVPMSSEDMKGLSPDEVQQKFEEAGFGNIEQKGDSLSTEPYGAVAEVAIGDATSFESGDAFAADSDIVITYSENEGKDEEEEADAGRSGEGSTYTSWVENQFSWWDGSNDKFVELVKGRLNDEKSFEHIETRLVPIGDEATLAEMNEPLGSLGYSLNMHDVYLVMDFTAKNGFNATVKNQAQGIIRYPSGEVELVAVY